MASMDSSCSGGRGLQAIVKFNVGLQKKLSLKKFLSGLGRNLTEKKIIFFQVCFSYLILFSYEKT